MKTVVPFGPCPCGTGRPFAACCEPLLRGERDARTPVELMRSRYTAHVLADEAYLDRTDARTAGRPAKARRRAAASVTWTRLEVEREEPGPNAELGYVTFAAFYQDERGRPAVLREKSEFRRVDGRWLYTRAV